MVSQCDLFYLKMVFALILICVCSDSGECAGLFEIRGDVGCAGATG